MDLPTSLAPLLGRSTSDSENQQALEAAGLLPNLCAADLVKDMELYASKTGMYSVFDADEFQMYCYKVLPCPKGYRHNWQTCPFAHVMERARRRDPRTCLYMDEFCEYAKKKKYCPRGDGCTYAHNLLELWLHPNRYRTIICKDGEGCKRELCFFAHCESQLRQPPPGFPRASTQSYGAQLGHSVGAGAYPSKHYPSSLGLRKEYGMAGQHQQMGLPGRTPGIARSAVSRGVEDHQAALLSELLAAAAPQVVSNTTKENSSTELLLALLKAVQNNQQAASDTEQQQPMSLANLLQQSVGNSAAQQLPSSRLLQQFAALNVDGALLPSPGSPIQGDHFPTAQPRPASVRPAHAVAMGYPVQPASEAPILPGYSQGMQALFGTGASVLEAAEM